MDLWLWDPPDYQDCSTSQHDNEDHSLYDFSFGYGRDVIEEEALNERSCLQVLKILVDKAEEEIKELNENIMMLHCQLAWYNETLIEKNDHLNNLIKNLENVNPEDCHSPDLQLEQPVEQPQSFDGSPKPLLEHSAKRKQGDRGITDVSIQPTGGFNMEKLEVITSKDKKNVEEKECCTTMLKTNKRKSQSMELHVRNSNDLTRVDSMKEGSKSTRKVLKARAHKNVPLVSVKRETSEEPVTGRRHSLAFKEGEEERAREGEMKELEHQRQKIQTLRTNQEREMKKLKHQLQGLETLRTNPAISIEQESQKMGSSSSSSTQNVNVQQAYITSTSPSLPEKVTESSPSSQITRKRTNPVKSIERDGQKLGSSSSSAQNVNMQQAYIAPASTSLPEKVTESSLSSQITGDKNSCRKFPIKLEMKDYDTSSDVNVQQACIMSTSPSLPEKVTESSPSSQIIRKRTNPVKSIERDGQKLGSSSSSTQNVNVQAYIAPASTSLPEKVTESSLSSQNTGDKNSCRKFPIKLEMKDYDTSSNVNVQQAYIMSTSPSLPEKVTESSPSSQIIRKRTNPVKTIGRDGQKLGSSSSSTQNVNVQAYIAPASTSLPEKVTESSLSSQITGDKNSCRKFPMKLEMKDYDTSSLNRATEESRDDVWPCTDDLHKLTFRKLQDICKRLKMKGCSKLTKAELIKLLKQKAPDLP